MNLVPAIIKDGIANRLSPSRKMIRMSDALNQADDYYRARRAQLGMTNNASGMGGEMDKTTYFKFLPAWLNDPMTIESVCAQSWMAKRFINLPIDFMFAKGRVYEDDDFKDAINKLGVDIKISDTMKLGRKFGTGLFWLVTKEASPSTPMNINNIRSGDVVNCISVDQGDVSIVTTTKDIMSTNHGKPEIYRISMKDMGTIDVHYSRVYRYDGQKAESSNGFRFFNPQWGISELAIAIDDLINHKSVTGAVSHLMQETSIPVHKIEGLNEIMCAGKRPDEVDVKQVMKEFSYNKSVYRTAFLDKNDEFNREAVNFSNIPELMDKFCEIFAMASGISVTAFLGKSASGLNATGEGDKMNDSRVTGIRQLKELLPFYNWIDPIIAKSAGTSVPSYTFPPMVEMSDEDFSKVSLNRSRTVKVMVDCGAWSPLEGKEFTSSGCYPIGELSPEAVRLQAGNDPDNDDSDGDNEIIKTIDPETDVNNDVTRSQLK